MFFYFSSRRRHTRWNCDWSSDVCSSDLGEGRLPLVAFPAAQLPHEHDAAPCGVGYVDLFGLQRGSGEDGVPGEIGPHQGMVTFRAGILVIANPMLTCCGSSMLPSSDSVVTLAGNTSIFWPVTSPSQRNTANPAVSLGSTVRTS